VPLLRWFRFDMRRGNFNFAVAVAVSLVAHALLWRASERIVIPNDGASGLRSRHASQITLLLNSGSSEPALKPILLPKPKAPDIDSPEDMGEHGGKGTGAQPAKGDTPLKAREADQDQAFLSRDPIGHGRVGDPPAFNTGPRGQNGHGGQAGAAQAAEAGSRESGVGSKKVEVGSGESGVGSKSKVAERMPSGEKSDSPLSTPHAPPLAKSDSSLPTLHSPPPLTPPPSETAKTGAAKPNLEKPVVNEVKPSDPLARAPKVADDSIAIAPAEGPSVVPVSASGTAPPTPKAAEEHPAVALAMASPLPPAPVAAPPPREQESPAPKPTEDMALAKPAVVPPSASSSSAVTPAPAAPALVSTGDSRAPGFDRPSADPAQESDSESDPFSKTSISAVLHDGRLDVREGRKIKTTRPHFLPGAVGAFLANPDPILVLKISITPSGAVKNVDVVRSSGSVEIDQPCRVAVYDWWFEPSHDKKGRPVADVVLFTIRFR
jgi:TonB family protein